MTLAAGFIRDISAIWLFQPHATQRGGQRRSRLRYQVSAARSVSMFRAR